MCGAARLDDGDQLSNVHFSLAAAEGYDQLLSDSVYLRQVMNN
jgi:hypothetical protein